MRVRGSGTVLVSAWGCEPSESGRLFPTESDALAELNEVAAVYHALPYERWMTNRILKNLYSANPKPTRATKDDGPVGYLAGGILITSAGSATVIVLAGMLSIFASGGATWAYSVVYVGVVAFVLGMLRTLPVFLASQRYLKTGDWRPARLRAKTPPTNLGGAPWRSPRGSVDVSRLPPPPSLPPIPPPSAPPRNRGPRDNGDREGPRP